MFEKEAEKYATRDVFFNGVPEPIINHQRKEDWQKGAEFGYNKANEWHYKGVPENENDILCQIDKDIVVVGYFHQKYKQYYTTSGEWLETVIAWKEIVLPELKESE